MTQINIEVHRSVNSKSREEIEEEIVAKYRSRVK